MRNILGITIILTILSGCMSYGHFGHEKVYGGYKDNLIAKGTYELEYHGGSAQSYEKLESFFNRRAGELCQSGYEIQDLEHREYEEAFEYSFIAGPTKFRAVTGVVVCAHSQA
jgi:hypothetical protein